MDSPHLSWITSMDGLLILVLSLSAYVVYEAFSRQRQRRRSPPGPRGLPIIGNALQIPSENQFEVFAEWGAAFGDIVHIKAFSQSIVILNSLQAARDLLEKRSTIYSDRPRFVLLSEFGPSFRKHRRLINQSFNNQAVAAFRPLQEKAVITALENLSKAPEDFLQHFRQFAAGTILKITYGHEVTSTHDPFIQLAERAGTLTVEAGSSAANLVDFFPVMRQGRFRLHIPTWAPFSTFKTKAMETRKAVEALMEIPYEHVKSQMKSGRAVPSYTSMLLQRYSGPDGSISTEDEEAIRGSAGTLLTLGAISTFLLAMVLNPDELKRAQQEIDAVVGTDRLPNMCDRPSLPYLECVLKEVLRWNPPVPLGLPHRLTEDDIYRDFYVAAGTTVFANIHAILQDCDDPRDFRPQRYLEDESLPDPLGVVFGFGRRVCPGRYLAESNYWILAAAVVAAFDISKVLDENGNDLNKSYDFSSGFVRHPEPFKCSIKPRLPNLTQVLRKAKADFDVGVILNPSEDQARSI
ncbi:LOW QUALITY PROTEIN: hypothetical protein CVT26_013875 [Gymnopilus dilepis]|uniref:Cytochrome P450 n=1 Tax=Gymnopilus dilepis TaxID=231916 RepID=A0A409Y621_9AGAR|nr:LOW QUALITY PROTEIN: hypothetical protein CVT26_013875 [Gymnopilus dilepis]